MIEGFPFLCSLCLCGKSLIVHHRDTERTMRPKKQPQYLFPGEAQFGADNLVLHAKGTRHRVNEFPGPLSIKSVISGEVGWVVDGRNIVVDTRSFLVLGDGQKYSMNVDAPRPVETCCAFFRRGFVEQVTQDMTSPLQASIDEPQRQAPPLKFLSRLHSDPRGRILPSLWSLAVRCSKQLQPSSFEEDFLVLSAELMKLYREITVQISRVTCGQSFDTRRTLPPSSAGKGIHSQQSGSASFVGRGGSRVLSFSISPASVVHAGISTNTACIPDGSSIGKSPIFAAKPVIR